MSKLTLRQAARQAIDVQDACNLSGVVFAFSRAMETLCEESRRIGEGTEWRNRHPISVLFSNKIADLTGSEPIKNWNRAYDECQRIAGS